MDPKSIANLDPKLRETYERVMGAAPTAPASPDNQASPMSPSPTPAAPTPPPDFSSPVSPEPQLSAPLSSSTVQATGASIPASTSYTPADLGLSAASQPSPGGDMQPLTSPAAVAQSSQGTGSLIKILYIFGGIVFFVVYVFFWIKIFNYQLPF